jgi:ParB-like chromosome segregation protein Spo0J
MNTTTEYRDLPLNQLTESNTNPRRIFEDSPLRELAESIRTQVPARPRLLASTSAKDPRLEIMDDHSCAPSFAR